MAIAFGFTVYIKENTSLQQLTRGSDFQPSAPLLPDPSVLHGAQGGFPYMKSTSL